jgi:hypothetical protein
MSNFIKLHLTLIELLHATDGQIDTVKPMGAFFQFRCEGACKFSLYFFLLHLENYV